MSQRFSPNGRLRRSDLVVGRLVEHGEANYQFDSNESPSYFLKVLTNRGERVFWGVLIREELRRSVTQPKIDDQIGIQRTGIQTFRFGNKVVRRNVWTIERVQFFAERARLARRVREDHLETRDAMRERPELRSSFLSMRAAQEYAERRIANPEDRERFLDAIRSVVDGSIVKKIPLPDVRLRGAVTSPSARSKKGPDRSR